MSTTSSLEAFNNLERIEPYSLEEYNKILEDNSPYSKTIFREVSTSTIETFKNTTLDYNTSIKLLICSKCSTTINNSLNSIRGHLKVSTSSRYLSI